MKRFLGFFLTLSLAGSLAYAQSTMPAMGANTPKGEVAKTDASINQTSAETRSNASSKTKMSTGKRKTKTVKTKSISTM